MICGKKSAEFAAGLGFPAASEAIDNIQEVHHQEPAKTIDESFSSECTDALWVSSLQAQPMPSSSELAVLLTFNRHPASMDAALKRSDLGRRLAASQHEIQPPWANGAKIMVMGLDEAVWHRAIREADLPQSLLQLKAYHVVAPANKVDDILGIVAEIPGSSRPRLKAGRRFQIPGVGASSSSLPIIYDSASTTTLHSAGSDHINYDSAWLQGVREKALYLPIPHLNETRTFLHEAEEPMITPRSRATASDSQLPVNPRVWLESHVFIVEPFELLLLLWCLHRYELCCHHPLSGMCGALALKSSAGCESAGCEIGIYRRSLTPRLLGLVTMFALMGVPVTFAAMLGAWLKLESYVRAYLIYFLELTQLHRLLRCARRCVGPCGRVRLQHAAEGVRHAPVVVTSSCAQVLKFWAVQPQHHILKLIVDSAQEHLKSSTDGGWIFLQLTLGLFFALRGRRPWALQGLAMCAERLDGTLPSCRVGFELRLAHVLALLRSALCKPVALADPKDVQHLSVVILEAFLHTVPEMDQGRPWSDVLRFEWFCGHDVDWSWKHHGLVLDTPGSIANPPEGDLRLVLFDASLEQWLSRPEEAWGMETYTVETRISSSAPVDAFRSWEISQFKQMADSLLEAQVQVLACQKLVDPWLVDYLCSKGVSVLWRLSIRHVEFVRRLTGARPVTSLAATVKWGEVMGKVGSIALKRICQRDYVLLTPPANGMNISTILVSAPDDHALQELKQCVPQAVHCLWATVQGSGFVVPGAGLIELQLAMDLDQWAQSLQKEEQPTHTAGRDTLVFAIKAVATCFKDAAASLVEEAAEHQCPSASAAGIAMMDAATEALQRWKETSDLPAGMVFDAESSKLRSIRSAIDLAAVLLRIGRTLDFRTTTIGLPSVKRAGFEWVREA
ncbi:unnamed protein product [Durusdinium trenchii]|uniref:Anaphase-promoting complex subunit 1 n=1 Tax=Durusdinium trenchii TaxID=1381693 RepID=A0ABP0RC02_9DINO